ncbi:lipid IV(A) 3-deoxy-D-manno-octulosonic acid transferase [Halarcobacter ebronensis]|uniref:3-deoxy-D-manno-octulosonic acid transferase n=1 Tax=Halarcobacter ebronensis TaxID=1462615 RepID=A0A4V1M0N7_9BACT|nr:lipid IV(A) 3-deoxy-D-manno-octulosonic acid transferase [Halarcobacter ebronensis]QKF82923.1 3-deoxy-D-manno-octulosonic-acid transferase (KDO transferase) [Halarcobacter ebronensis]RXK06938.1 3-deoxy-D-manno-octulosonic acid transferase [Halarcobacter ebronensis]
MSFFSVVYYILASLAYLLIFPYLLFKLRNPKYKVAIPSKFFLKENPSFKEEGIWFHTCSMGETKAIKPLVDEFKNNFPINISVITNTGFQEAKKLTTNVRYLPFEIFLPFWIKKQKVLVVMEAELWYMLFLCAKKRGAKTYLINARISDKSYASYKKFSFFYKKIFKNIDKIFAQTQIDKKRLLELGAKEVEVIGNIKLAQLPIVTKELKRVDEVLITAGSTHENEEKLILESYKKEFGKLVIVPRHPERFEKVNLLIEEYIKDKNLTYHRFSSNESFDSDIILVDKLGELNNIYAISDVVILGGAFENIGGHNPIEPAYFGCKLISGKNIFNQKSLFECVNNYILIENEELRSTLENLQNLKGAKLVQKGDINPIIEELKGL